MTIKIGSNIASLNAQRKLGEAEASLSKVFERLSSGQRINRASDDAAGLAIADDLKAKSRIYTQAIRNGNDGISLLNIADSALDALSGVVTRIRELSEQAANGTYSAQQRAALDAEAQALSKEFTRITQTTSFNGIKLFDGSLGQGVRLQLGIGTSESINASIGGAVGTGNFGSLTYYSAEGRGSSASVLGDLNGDGILDLVSTGYNDSNVGYTTVRLGNGDGSFGNATSYSAESSYSFSLSLGDLNSDGILDLVTAGRDNSGHGSATVRLGNGDGTFGLSQSYSTESYSSRTVRLGDLNGDGKLDLVTSGYAAGTPGNGFATVRLGNGNGTFGTASSYTMDKYNSYHLELGDMNGDGKLDLVTTGYSDNVGYYSTVSIRFGTGNGTFGSVNSISTEGVYNFKFAVGDLNNDNIIDLIVSGMDDTYTDYAAIKYGLGNGTFSAGVALSTYGIIPSAINLSDLNGDGNLDFIYSGSDGSINTARIFLNNGAGSFASSAVITSSGRLVSSIVTGDLNGDGVADYVSSTSITTSVANYDGKVEVRLGSTKEGLGAISPFSLTTRSNALQAMSVLDKSLQNLSKQRGVIGASQSRVQIALNNLQTSNENFKVAESRIRDADIAAESAALIRTQILQQAAASVLSQANQQPQLALQLLR